MSPSSTSREVPTGLTKKQSRQEWESELNLVVVSLAISVLAVPVASMLLLKDEVEKSTIVHYIASQECTLTGNPFPATGFVYLSEYVHMSLDPSYHREITECRQE